MSVTEKGFFFLFNENTPSANTLNDISTYPAAFPVWLSDGANIEPSAQPNKHVEESSLPAVVVLGTAQRASKMLSNLESVHKMLKGPERSALMNEGNDVPDTTVFA